MEARDIIFGLITVMFVAIAWNFFYFNVAVESGITDVEGLNTTAFNRTRELQDMFHNQSETSQALEDIPFIGDVVAVVGNSMRALHLLFSIPSIFMNMVTEAVGIFGIPAWIWDMFSLFVWTAIIFIVISAGLRYRT